MCVGEALCVRVCVYYLTFKRKYQISKYLNCFSSNLSKVLCF